MYFYSYCRKSIKFRSVSLNNLLRPWLNFTEKTCWNFPWKTSKILVDWGQILVTVLHFLFPNNSRYINSADGTRIYSNQDWHRRGQSFSLPFSQDRKHMVSLVLGEDVYISEMNPVSVLTKQIPNRYRRLNLAHSEKGNP